jgi:hypothetical protein
MLKKRAREEKAEEAGESWYDAKQAKKVPQQAPRENAAPPASYQEFAGNYPYPPVGPAGPHGFGPRPSPQTGPVGQHGFGPRPGGPTGFGPRPGGPTGFGPRPGGPTGFGPRPGRPTGFAPPRPGPSGGFGLRGPFTDPGAAGGYYPPPQRPPFAGAGPPTTGFGTRGPRPPFPRPSGQTPTSSIPMPETRQGPEPRPGPAPRPSPSYNYEPEAEEEEAAGTSFSGPVSLGDRLKMHRNMATIVNEVEQGRNKPNLTSLLN